MTVAASLCGVQRGGIIAQGQSARLKPDPSLVTKRLKVATNQMGALPYHLGLDATIGSERNVSSAWGLPDLNGGASRPMPFSL